MKLTAKQKEVIDKFNQLEKEYGEGNVFLRHVNDYWKVMFVIHTKGEDKVNLLLKEEYKVNGRIVNSLEEKEIVKPFNKWHEQVENANASFHNGELVGWKIVL